MSTQDLTAEAVTEQATSFDVDAATDRALAEAVIRYPYVPLLDAGDQVGPELRAAVDQAEEVIRNYVPVAARHTAMDELNRDGCLEEEWEEVDKGFVAYLERWRSTATKILDVPTASPAETLAQVTAYLRTEALFCAREWRPMTLETAIDLVEEHGLDTDTLANACRVLAVGMNQFAKTEPVSDDAELIALGAQWKQALAEYRRLDSERDTAEGEMNSVPLPAALRWGADPAVNDAKLGLPWDGSRRFYPGDREKITQLRDLYAPSVDQYEHARLKVARCEAILTALNDYVAARMAAAEKAGLDALEDATSAADTVVVDLNARILALEAKTVAGLRVKAMLCAEEAAVLDEPEYSDDVLWSLLGNLGQRSDEREGVLWVERFLEAGGIISMSQGDGDEESPISFCAPVTTGDGEALAMARDLTPDHPFHPNVRRAALRRMLRQDVHVLSYQDRGE